MSGPVNSASIRLASSSRGAPASAETAASAFGLRESEACAAGARWWQPPSSSGAGSNPSKAIVRRNPIGAYLTDKQDKMATAKTARPKATRASAPRTGPRTWPRLVAGLAVLMLGLAWYYHGEVMARAVAGTAYGARVGCSCRFVGGRGLRDCRKDFEPWMR